MRQSRHDEPVHRTKKKKRFPIAIFFAWAFELTPEGLKKEKDVDRSQSVTVTTGRSASAAPTNT